MKRTLQQINRFASTAMAGTLPLGGVRRGLLFALVAIMMPITAWAQDATVEARWGTSAETLTGAGTLDEAIDAAWREGSTVGYIQLQSDVAGSYAISRGVFTLDLNGHALTSDEDVPLSICYSGTSVTLIGEAEGSRVVATMEGCSPIYVQDGALVTIASGSYEGFSAIHVYDATSTAVITGGEFSSTATYAIYNKGTLTVSGGEFTAVDGYAVYTYVTSVTTITGGSFTTGSSESTFDYQGGVLDLSEYASIADISVYNTTDAPFAPGAETILLPSGYCFYEGEEPVTVLANVQKYTIGEEPETKYTVTFAAGGGEGTMEDGISYGGDYMLPECAFTAPEGKMFKAWQVGESEHQPGETVTVTANTTITALWRDYVPQITIKMQDSYGDGWHGDAIVVKKDGEEIGTATIESGASNTVRYDYDNTAEYTFYWQFAEGSRFPEECSFEILVEDEVVLAVAEGDCESYEDGQLIHTIEVKEATVETLTLADGELTEYSSAWALTTVGTLTYTRTLPNQEWNALYVPFEIPVSELTDSYDVAYINDVHSYDNDEDGEIDELKMEVIHITTGTLNANYPYLIRAKSEKAKAMTLTLTDAMLYKTVETTVTCSSVFMQFDVTGTYSQMTAGDLTDDEGNTSLVITTDGSWQQLAEKSVLNPFRLYLTMTALDGSPVKVAPEAMARMRIVTRGESEDGEMTQIENSKLEIENSGAVYDLRGRRVAHSTKGIYIVNGKKVVIK